MDDDRLSVTDEHWLPGIQASLRDAGVWRGEPGIKTPGYWQASLRDANVGCDGYPALKTPGY